MMEWLANLRVEYVIAAALVLLLARLILGRYKTPLAKAAAETAESALIAVVLVFLIIRPFIVQAFFIPSESMLPTLQVRDHILVNKFIYRFKEPAYGDVVVFRAPSSASGDGTEKDFIKRLIGREGDVIEVKNGAVYRNGERLQEPYVLQPPDYEMKPVKIPEGKVFVMGDNRANSNDSHAWGPLNSDRILGKAMIIFWPPNRIGRVR